MSPIPLPDQLLGDLAAEHGTPLFVYDATTVRRRVAELQGHFDVVRYAQKANSSRDLLALVRAAGCQVDAVSAGEVECARAAGFEAQEIVFTSDLFDRAGLQAVERLDLPVNLGSMDMIEQYAALGGSRAITLRVNPGFGAGHSGAVTTGGESSKHGIWHGDLAGAVERARAVGLEVEGLHVHVGSGADGGSLARAAAAMEEFGKSVGASLRRVSAGGGLPVPSRPGQARLDLAALSGAWRACLRELGQFVGHALELEIEPGRYLVAECGVLLTEVRATKRNGSLDYVLVDAGFHNLPRPMLYGSHHEIDVLGAPTDARRSPKVVAGPLCESADVFTQDGRGKLAPRTLPDAPVGALLCIRNTGAYAASMASNYNGQPFAAEVMVDAGQARLIRARQSLAEMMRGGH